ncbi:MAG TPA: ATP-binding protein [Gemmatimonadota bacterium]|nr:ATP-binding protein [Gemmatimonadota bacterium]
MAADLARTQMLLIVNVLVVLMVVGGAAAVAYLLVRRAVRDRVASERLAAMGVASARILHQVKNPVATILIQGELLEEGTLEGPAERREAAHEIAAAAGRVSTLLHELSAYASGQSRQITPIAIELAPLLEDTVRAALAAHPDSEPPSLDLGDALTVLADVHMLRQALDNVVGNALEAMAGTGRLRVGVARRGSDAAVTIADEGPGIPADRIRRVLEPFVTSKATGMGLGIPVARDIVEAHGGKFDLRSRVGQGTTVTLLIPLAEG